MSAPCKLWREAILPQNATIKEAINNLNKNGIKIAFVLNKNNQLEGTVSDGDIRRALLRGDDLSDSIIGLIHRNCLVAPSGMSRDIVMQLMVTNKVQQIPIVDENRHLIGLHLWSEIATGQVHSSLMVIMAGGVGKRLMPHTKNCPKPLLSISGKPMLEHIIERAKLEGFRNFVIAINYLGEMIEDYFGDGDKFGVKIEYLREQSSLGTAGALSLFRFKPNTPFVVTNGDVITDIRYGELLDFHNRNLAVATMAVRNYELQHPFGVVNVRGLDIVNFDEKPVFRNHINAGVYVLSPEVLGELILDKPCDMTTLFERLKEKNQRIIAYPMHEEWLDVGRPIDLQRANGNILAD